MPETKHNIVITDCDHGFIDPEISVFKNLNAKLTLAQVKTSDELIEKCSKADGLIVQYTNISEDILRALPLCKVISRYGVGVDTIDLNAATKYGVVVAHVPDYSINEVALHATSFLLAFYRKINFADQFVKSGIWDYIKIDPIIHNEKTVVGILGLGRIGSAFAQNILRLGFKIIAHDPHVKKCIDGVKMVGFDEVLNKSDFISIHCHLTKDTFHLLKIDQFKK